MIDNACLHTVDITIIIAVTCKHMQTQRRRLENSKGGPSPTRRNEWVQASSPCSMLRIGQSIFAKDSKRNTNECNECRICISHRMLWTKHL